MDSKVTAISCLLFYLLTSQVLAETCDLSDSDFPNEDCSFADLGVNTQMLKFGHVDAVFDLGSTSSSTVRFGSANFTLPDSAELHRVIDDDDCSSGDGDDLEFIDDNFGVDDVAFIPSSTDSREITKIWVLDCNIVQDR